MLIQVMSMRFRRVRAITPENIIKPCAKSFIPTIDMYTARFTIIVVTLGTYIIICNCVIY